jgi:hypothetical protein
MHLEAGERAPLAARGGAGERQGGEGAHKKQGATHTRPPQNFKCVAPRASTFFCVSGGHARCKRTK